MIVVEKLSKVDKLLFAMYTENTGAALCDSGGAYGRHWERNQHLTIQKAMDMPTVTHEIFEYNDGKCELNACVNVFKYLVNAGLELDEICNGFNNRQNRAKDWDYEGEMYGVSKSAGEYLEKFEPTYEATWNTYNDHAQFLSQVLQGCYVEIEDNKYLLLQIHQGCDVRGGYTNTKMFKFNDRSEGYMPLVDIYGSIDGIDVSNTYNGYSLTDENGEEPAINKDSKVELYLMEY